MRRFAILLLLTSCRPIVLPPAPVPTAAPTVRPVPVVEVKAFVSGKALFRVSGVEGLRFGSGDGRLDNITILTMLLAPGVVEGPAVEIALRGVEDVACERRPCQGRVGVVARYSPWIAEDSRLYQQRKMRPEGDYYGTGLRYQNRVPLGTPQPDGSFLVEVSWGPDGVRLGSALLAGRCPGAAQFGAWSPGGLGIGWATPAFDAVRRGARVELLSWSGVPGTRVACP